MVGRTKELCNTEDKICYFIIVLRCGKVILAFGPCANVRQANAATALVPPLGAAR
jgi:hypothetical protein